MWKQKLKELRARVHSLQTQGKDRLAKMKALEAKTGRTEEEDTQLATLETECTKIAGDIETAKAEITRLEAQEKFENLFMQQQGNPQALNSNPRIQVFEEDPARSGGFRNIAEFALSVQRQCTNVGRDDRLFRAYAPGNGDRNAAPSNFHQEIGGSSGEGFEVPPAMRDTIWSLVFGQGDLIDLIDLETTAATTVGMLKDETTPWGSSGIFARWRAEGTQMTPQKMGVGANLLQMNELYCFVLATGELLDDAPRLATRLTTKTGQAIRWKLSESIITGDGAGQPLGYLNSPALVTVTKEAGQLTATLNVTNLAKMYARALIMPGDKPIWLANRDILPQLITMQIGNVPVFVPQNQGIVGAPDGYLLGLPIVFTEHAKSLGFKGDIQLVNLKGYYGIQKSNQPDFATSIHLYFDYNITAFRWMFRFGGAPYLSTPVTPANGAATKSHFVMLEDRP